MSTPTNPPAKHPSPRNLATDLDHPCRDSCSGWKQGYQRGQENLREHYTALLQEARARAFEEAYKEWLKLNPDFKPNNRYDDFFKDAFYCGFGRGMEVGKAARSPGDAEKGEK